MPENTTTNTEPARDLFIPANGTIQITPRLNPHTAAVTYTVDGHRISGSVSIRVAHPLKTRTTTWIQFGYGIATETDAEQWPDRLTVNGIRLIGIDYDTQLPPRNPAPDTTTGITHETTGFRVRRPSTTGPGTEPAPPTTIALTLTLLAALVDDFAQRPDLPELHRLAAARAARTEIATSIQQLATLESHAADLRAAIRRTRRRADVLTLIASTDPLPQPAVDLLART